MRRRSPSCRLERGTTAVELSLVLPVLLLFVFGTVDFGRAIVLYNGMALAARDGARSAQVGIRPGDAALSVAARDAANAAAQRIASTVAGSGSAFTTTTSAARDASGYWYVTTSARVTYAPVVGGFLGVTGLPLGASSTLAVPCGRCA